MEDLLINYSNSCTSALLADYHLTHTHAQITVGERTHSYQMPMAPVRIVSIDSSLSFRHRLGSVPLCSVFCLEYHPAKGNESHDPRDTKPNERRVFGRLAVELTYINSRHLHMTMIIILNGKVSHNGPK